MDGWIDGWMDEKWMGEESGEKASLMEGSTEEVVFVLGLKE